MLSSTTWLYKYLKLWLFFFPRKFDGPGVNSVDTLTLTQNRSNICRPCHRDVIVKCSSYLLSCKKADPKFRAENNGTIYFVHTSVTWMELCGNSMSLLHSAWRWGLESEGVHAWLSVLVDLDVGCQPDIYTQPLHEAWVPRWAAPQCEEVEASSPQKPRSSLPLHPTHADSRRHQSQEFLQVKELDKCTAPLDGRVGKVSQEHARLKIFPYPFFWENAISPKQGAWSLIQPHMTPKCWRRETQGKCGRGQSSDLSPSISLFWSRVISLWLQS